MCTDWAGAFPSRSAHSSNQAGCQTNRWSQQRDVSLCLLRCDCNRCNADTDAWHSVTAYCVYTAGIHFDLFWGRFRGGGWHCAHDHTQDNVCQQQQRCYCVRETKTDNGGWFHGAVMLHVHSSEDYHMLGGGASQSVFRGAGFDLLCAWFNLRGELWPLHTARSKSHYLNAILSLIFFFLQAPSLKSISTLPPR